MNPTWKKRIGATILTVMLTAAVGCSNGKNEPATGTSSNTPAKKNVQMRMFWWGGDARHQATLAAIDNYTKKNPTVKIDGEYMGFDGVFPKISTQLASGTAADVIQIDSNWIEDFATRGDLFVNLNDYKNVIDLSGFDDKFLQKFGVMNNKLIALPLGINSQAFIFNTELTQKFGIDYTQTWDWEAVLNEGKKVNQQDPNMYFLSAERDNVRDMIFIPYIIQKTGLPFIKGDYTPGFDRTVVKEAFDYVRKLYDTKVLQPASEAFLYTGKFDQNPKWINKQFVATINNTSTIQLLTKNFKADVSLVPIAKDAKDTGIIVRPSNLIAINKKSESVDEAAKFVNYFVNDKDAALTLKDVRSIPAVQSTRKTIADANVVDPLVVKAVDIAVKKDGNTASSLTNNSEIANIINTFVEKVAYGTVTPDQAADDMTKRINDKLRELKANKQ